MQIHGRYLHQTVFYGAFIALSIFALSVRAQQVPEQSRGSDDGRNELASFDLFLDTHTEISNDLKSNPSLVNDKNYLKGHRDLSKFLAKHRRVREEINDNPSSFMRRENRSEATEAIPRPSVNANLSEKQIAERKEFLEKHRDIDRDLQANPALATDYDYVRHHKALRKFEDKHPEVWRDFRENSSFDRDRREITVAGAAPNAPPVNPYGNNLSPKQIAERDGFLEKHVEIARDLQNDPSLASDHKYLKHHKDLRKFGDRHPDLRSHMADPASSSLEVRINEVDRGKSDTRKSKHEQKKSEAHDKAQAKTQSEQQEDLHGAPAK